MKKIVLTTLCIVLFIAGASLPGCTSASTTTAPAGTTVQLAAAAETAVTSVPVSAAVSTATATSAAAAVATTTVAPVDPVTVTVNSVEQKSQIGSIKPKEGNAFLVLDVTLHNNDPNEDFAYTPDSFQIIANNPGSSWHGTSTIVFTSGLDRQIKSGTIPMKSDISGQLVFGVSGNANSFKFSVRDSKGNEVARVDNIHIS